MRGVRISDAQGFSDLKIWDVKVVRRCRVNLGVQFVSVLGSASSSWNFVFSLLLPMLFTAMISLCVSPLSLSRSLTFHNWYSH